jgi:hypothetical protein
MSERIIYVDIETRNFFGDEVIKDLPRELQILSMDFGLAVTWNSDEWEAALPEIDFLNFEYSGEEDAFYGWPDYQAKLLWEYLMTADIIAGYNITTFDLPVIARTAGVRVGDHRYNMNKALKFPRVYDLFYVIKETTGRWYKLEDLAQANLSKGKTADGLQAARWLATRDKKDYWKAFEYCKNDVALEVQLGELARGGYPIKLPKTEKYSGEMIVTLDWDPDPGPELNHGCVCSVCHYLKI